MLNGDSIVFMPDSECFAVDLARGLIVISDGRYASATVRPIPDCAAAPDVSPIDHLSDPAVTHVAGYQEQP